MVKPLVGDAVTPAQEQKKQQKVKELKVLKPDSSESIFNLVFSENKKESLNK